MLVLIVADVGRPLKTTLRTLCVKNLHSNHILHTSTLPAFGAPQNFVDAKACILQRTRTSLEQQHNQLNVWKGEACETDRIGGGDVFLPGAWGVS